MSESMKLENKVAIVTGAGSGIGRAIALAFAQEGARVLLAGRTRGSLQEVAEEIQFARREPWACPVDVTRVDSVRHMVEEALGKFGSIDILVNSAGVFIPKSFLRVTLEDWDRTLDTNLKGTFLCCQTVVPYMIARRQGNIINISSIHGKRGDANLVPHCASKFGVIGLTQALAREVVDHNIYVNAICPGQVNSRWIEDDSKNPALPPAKLEPADVAKVAVFLASLDTAIMTGSVIDIFGQTHMKID